MNKIRDHFVDMGLLWMELDCYHSPAKKYLEHN